MQPTVRRTEFAAIPNFGQVASRRARPAYVGIWLTYAGPYVVPYANLFLTYGSRLGLEYDMDR